MCKIMIRWFSVALIMFSTALFAAPTAQVKATTRYPWDGLVDIECTVTGVESPTNKYVTLTRVDQTSGQRTTLRNVTLKGVSGNNNFNCLFTNKVYQFIWNAMADIGPNQILSNTYFEVTFSPPPPPLYCIVDLSGGTSASSYPVSYLDDVPSGGWKDEHKTTKLVLRRINAGSFTMGGRSTDYPGASDSGLHEVTLTQDYWIGVFEVTQRQWELVMGTNPSYFNNSTYYASRPVEQVSYNMIRGASSGAGWPDNSNVDSTSFIGKLRSKVPSLRFDLPTEAQWEYACRAGTTTALNSGKNLTSTSSCTNMAEVGRYYYNGGSSSSKSCTTSGGTAKAGSYKPNAWGLYDMHGNVYEWCLDWYGLLSSSAATDPKGATSGDDRVLRGGSGYGNARYCRSAHRNYGNPSGDYYGIGLRLVAIPTVP